MISSSSVTTISWEDYVTNILILEPHNVLSCTALKQSSINKLFCQRTSHLLWFVFGYDEQQLEILMRMWDLTFFMRIFPYDIVGENHQGKTKSHFHQNIRKISSFKSIFVKLFLFSITFLKSKLTYLDEFYFRSALYIMTNYPGAAQVSDSFSGDSCSCLDWYYVLCSIIH